VQKGENKNYTHLTYLVTSKLTKKTLERL